ALEKLWNTYLESNYNNRQKRHSFLKLDEVDRASNGLDHFVISPNAELMAFREVDKETGLSYVTILDRKKREKIRVTRDNRPDHLTLYAMQAPGLALLDDLIVYAVGTVHGPVLEFRRLARDDESGLSISKPMRSHLHRYDILHAGYLTFSPDQKHLAFTGLD